MEALLEQAFDSLTPEERSRFSTMLNNVLGEWSKFPTVPSADPVPQETPDDVVSNETSSAVPVPQETPADVVSNETSSADVVSQETSADVVSQETSQVMKSTIDNGTRQVSYGPSDQFLHNLKAFCEQNGYKLEVQYAITRITSATADIGRNVIMHLDMSHISADYTGDADDVQVIHG